LFSLCKGWYSRTGWNKANKAFVDGFQDRGQGRIPMIGYSMNNWANMPEGKSKYQAYLASREWVAIKQQVHTRSGGICERCRHNPGESVHHLTYERKYREHIDDLRHVCTPCHEFEHGIRNRDPILDVPVKLNGREVRSVYLAGRITPPRGAWRNQIAPLWDEDGWGSPGVQLGTPTAGLGADIPDGRSLRVAGPFWASIEHTGGGHLWYSKGGAIGIHAIEGAFSFCSHGMRYPDGISAYEVRNQILEWLRDTDLMFAWIEDRECFGTLWELGFAEAMPDTIVVVATPTFDRELWLPAAMADILIYAPTAGEAWARLWARKENIISHHLFDDEAWDAYRKSQYGPDEEDPDTADDESESTQ
jgi:hypothetical protein